MEKSKEHQRNSNRSDIYQPLLLEISVSPFILSDLSSAQNITYRMNPDAYSEKFLDLREKLIKRMWELIEIGLTTRQKQVLKLWQQGLTQNEIAKILSINQTSVHKVLRGNIDYKNKRKRYGGCLKKIIKLCSSDQEIQQILKEIQEIGECLEL